LPPEKEESTNRKVIIVVVFEKPVYFVLGIRGCPTTQKRVILPPPDFIKNTLSDFPQVGHVSDIPHPVCGRISCDWKYPQIGKHLIFFV
jgi:hypothetical protein